MKFQSLNGGFSCHEYSQEELVAEFGASMLCGIAGIEQADYRESSCFY